MGDKLKENNNQNNISNNTSINKIVDYLNQITNDNVSISYFISKKNNDEKPSYYSKNKIIDIEEKCYDLFCKSKKTIISDELINYKCGYVTEINQFEEFDLIKKNIEVKLNSLPLKERKSKSCLIRYDKRKRHSKEKGNYFQVNRIDQKIILGIIPVQANLEDFLPNKYLE